MNFNMFIVINIISILSELPFITCPMDFFDPPDNYTAESIHSSDYEDIFGMSVYQRNNHRQEILVLGADQCNDIETITLLSVLSKAGINTRFAGVVKKHEENVFNTMWNLKIRPKFRMREVLKYVPYKMIVIPGGKGYMKCLFRKDIQNMIIEQDKNFRYIAALSTATLLLEYSEIGYGKHLTVPKCFKGKLDVQYHTNNIGVVHDGHILTSQGPLTAMEFSFYIVELFQGREKANKVASEMGYKRNLANIKIIKPHKN